MNKSLLVFIAFVMALTPALAHAGEETSGVSSTLTITPYDPPVVSKTSILEFQTFYSDGDKVYHIDGQLNISKDGQSVMESDWVHEHAGSFSIPFNFREPGTYRISISVKEGPPEDYLGPVIEPNLQTFTVEVAGQQSGSTGIDPTLLFGAAAFVAVAVGLFVWKIKKA